MDIHATKLELIQWLSTIENPSLIQKIKKLRDSQKEDWWNQLSQAEVDAIEEGIKDADEGNVVSHKEARKIYGKWL